MPPVKIFYLSFGLFSVLLMGCGGRKVPKNPLPGIVEAQKNSSSYTILLQDMDLDNKVFKHRYKILTDKPNGLPNESTTPWLPVSDDLFKLHKEDLGMEVAAKSPADGLNRLVTPPGFTNYVDNPKYGSWKPDSLSGKAYWVYHAAYAGLPGMLGTEKLKVSKQEYDTWKKSYYRSRPYYGQDARGRHLYGTSSAWIFFYRPGFFDRRTAKGGFTRRTTRSTPGFRRGGGGWGK